MIITLMAGGLGNQMFQYAIARSYVNRSGEKVYLDTCLLTAGEETDIEKIAHRPYGLHIFENLNGKVRRNKIAKLLNNGLLNTLKRRFFGRSVIVVEQREMEKIQIPDKTCLQEDIVLKGNFQSERYFREIRESLLYEFEFPKMDPQNEELKKSILQTPNAVSLHIRRGDYLSSKYNDIYNSINDNYYHKSISIILKELSFDKLDVFVFTDDVKWVKNHFTPVKTMNTYFVTGNTNENSWKDMALMSCCQHHIIANSSFSWWGAWLSKREGINLAPKHWFVPGTRYFDINEIIPHSWIIVDYAPMLLTKVDLY